MDFKARKAGRNKQANANATVATVSAISKRYHNSFRQRAERLLESQQPQGQPEQEQSGQP